MSYWRLGVALLLLCGYVSLVKLGAVLKSVPPPSVPQFVQLCKKSTSWKVGDEWIEVCTCTADPHRSTYVSTVYACDGTQGYWRTK